VQRTVTKRLDGDLKNPWKVGKVQQTVKTPRTLSQQNAQGRERPSVTQLLLLRAFFSLCRVRRGGNGLCRWLDRSFRGLRGLLGGKLNIGLSDNLVAGLGDNLVAGLGGSVAIAARRVGLRGARAERWRRSACLRARPDGDAW